MMRLLLDTCALLWFLTDDPKPSAPTKATIGYNCFRGEEGLENP